MAEELTFDILAIDKASEVFKRVGENAGDMGGEFGKVGKLLTTALAVGFTAAASGAALLAKVGVSEFKENQTAVAQLGAVIKSTGGAAGTSVDQMQKLADSIQNYSGQTHESVEQSEALLLGFTNIHDAAGKNNDILTRATSITADMAARMGGDAASNATKLGKALNDPTAGISSLTRVGVQFTAAQKDQIKAMQASGDTIGAQNLILDVLQTKFGGAAQAAGKTLPGELNRAKEAFDDVAASIVARLMPSITQIVGWITDKLIPLMGQIYDTEGPKVSAAFNTIGDILTNDVAPIMEKVGGFIADHTTLFKTLGVALAAGAGAILIVVEAMKAWAAIQKILDAELLANPIGLIVLAIAALAAGLIYAYKNSQTFRDIVQGAMRDVKSAFDDVVNVGKTVVDFFTQTIPSAVSTAVGFFEAMPGEIVSAFKTVTSAIINELTALPGQLLNLFETAVIDVLAYLIVGTVDIVKFFIDLPGRMLDAVVKFGPGFVKWAFDAFMDVEKQIGTSILGVMTFFTDLPGKILGAVVNFGPQIAKWMADAFVSTMKAATDGAITMLGWFGKLPGLVLGAVGDATKWLYGVGKDILQGLINGMEDMLASVGNIAGKIASGVTDKVKNLLGIHSPSTVFAEIGQNVVLGFNQGMSSASPSPASSMSSSMAVPSSPVVLSSRAGGITFAPVFNVTGADAANITAQLSSMLDAYTTTLVQQLRSA